MVYGISNNKTLADIYNGMDEGTIKLKPDFQRKLVWNNLHKEKFIDTILRGYPFPEVYFCDGEVDLSSKKTTKLVVDGQQRLSTIYNYIEGKMTLKSLPSYESLDDDDKKDFLKYQITVRDLGKIDDSEIKQIFKRINSINYALNATEIRNALYDGEFIFIAQNISSLFSKELPVFGESQISRMKDTELFLQIMVAIEMDGYFTSNDQVEELTKSYNDNYPNKGIMYGNLKGVLSLIQDLKLNPDSFWFKRSNFFTLLVELIKYKLINKNFPDSEKLKLELTKFEKLIEESKNKDIKENKYSQYYYYTYQGTNSKKGRITRGELLREHLKAL